MAVIFGLLGLVALYFSAFWSWASGAGNPPNAELLHRASRVVGVIALLFLTGSVVSVIGMNRRR
ncbi:hypothetical protein Hhel01_03048 [Haloferula helveola]